MGIHRAVLLHRYKRRQIDPATIPAGYKTIDPRFFDALLNGPVTRAQYQYLHDVVIGLFTH